MMSLINSKNISLFAFLFSILAISYALILQYFYGLLPCKLCSYQRIPYYLIIVTFMIKLVSKPNENLILIIICICFVFEFFISAYHSLITEGIINYSNCSSSINLPSQTEDLKTALQKNTLIIDCKDANKKIFGVTLSSYNAFTSFSFLIIFFYKCH